MKVLYNNEESEVIEETKNLYFIELVELKPITMSGVSEFFRRIIPVKKEWCEEVKDGKEPSSL